MIHTERDAAVLVGELLLCLGTLVGAVYAIAVLIALVLKAFRSPAALSISFALSSVASIPILSALVLQWPYLPAEWDRNPLGGVLALLQGMLLAFAWSAPAVQYRVFRPKSRGVPHPTADRPESPPRD